MNQFTQFEASRMDMIYWADSRGKMGLWASSTDKNRTRKAQNSGSSMKEKDLSVSKHKSNVCDLQKLGALLGT